RRSKRWRGSRPASARLLGAPAAQDGDERAAAKLVEGQGAALGGVRLRERAAAHGAQEVIEQALAGGGVVEDVTDQRRLRRLADEVAQPLGGRVEALEKEGVERGVAARQLGGMEVPALVEALFERV